MRIITRSGKKLKFGLKPVGGGETPNFFQFTNHGSNTTLYITSASSGTAYIDGKLTYVFDANRKTGLYFPAGSVMKVYGLRPRGQGQGTAYSNSSLDNISLDAFDAGITTPYYMFYQFTGLKSITSWAGAYNYTVMQDTFAFSSGLTSIPASWDGLKSVRELIGTFNGTKLNAIPNSWAGLNSIENLGDVFNGAPIRHIPATWDFPTKIRRMWGTFNGCRQIEAIPVSWKGLEDVWQMSNVFENNSGIVTGGTEDFGCLSKITNFTRCFRGCSSWTGNSYALYQYMSTKPVTVTYHEAVFENCTSSTGYSNIPSTWK